MYRYIVSIILEYGLLALYTYTIKLYALLFCENLHTEYFIQVKEGRIK